MMGKDKRILVIGSYNADLTARAKRIPGPGETVLGHGFAVTNGGKGSNQAVACAKAGAKCAFIAKLGHDTFGDMAMEMYRSVGLDTSGMLFSETEPTGAALIMVSDTTADNCILVSSGSNLSFDKDDEEKIKGYIDISDIILFQLEITPEVNFSLMRYAHEKGKRVILNTAPASELPEDLYPALFIVTPNEHEAALMTGIEVTDIPSADRACKALLDKGVKNVIITLGSMGAYIKNGEISCHVPAFRVEAVDTTGAGDAFNGALAAALLKGMDLIEASRFASAAAAISVTRPGAAVSSPYIEEIDKFLTEACYIC